MIIKHKWTLILLIFLALGTLTVHAQPPTDATYIQQIDQSANTQNKRINPAKRIMTLTLLIAAIFVSIYAYGQYIKKLKEEKEIQKEGIQKEG